MKAGKPESHRSGKADLKRAVEAMKNAAPRQHEVEEAAARVWARVSESGAGESPYREPESLRDCQDYRLLIGPYLAGELGRARVLLLEDHSSTCLGCRKAISEARREGATTPVSVPVGLGWPGFSARGFALAGLAAVLLIGLIAGGGGIVRQILFPVQVSASAQSVRGRLFRVDTELVPIRPGEEIGVRESVRTANDSSAILELSDGSRIEMDGRSELRLVPAGDGIRIQLERGSVIVEAADQGAGHLYVSTDDIDVVVVGTVFSVSEGTKGARVSVIEGEVRVEQGATVRSLLPGEQYNSSSALTEVPIEEEIAWSQTSEERIALMLELSRMREDLVAAVESPGLRYSSTLLGLAPDDTAVYVAIPNLARSLANAYDVFVTRIQENEITRNWWNDLQDSDAGGDGPSPEQLETMMGYLRSFSDQIGDEVVVAMGAENPAPLVMAEVQNADLVADVLRGLVALSDDPCRPAVLTSLDEEWPADDGSACGPTAFAGDGLLALSASGSVLREAVEAYVNGPAVSTNPFHQTLAAVYAEGTDWLFAADVDRLTADAVADDDTNPEATAARSAITTLLALDSVNDLFVDYKSIGGAASTRAALTFNQARTGIASWIAEPGPMGGLDFVSPQASLVASGLTRDMGAIVAEIFLALERIDPEEWSQFVAFQEQYRFDLQYDLASAMGGEFVLALDGPFLPTPSWKAIAEVYDSAALQNAIERLVFEFNRVSPLEDGPQLEAEAENVSGRVFHALRFSDGGPEIHYTFVGGYMVAGPTGALVNQSVQYYETRSTLGDSPQFRALFPAGSQNYCSAVMYQNVAAAAGSLSEFIPESTPLDGVQLEAVRDMLAESSPMLACVIAEENRILALNEGDSVFNILSLGGLNALIQQFGSSLQ